MLFYIIPFFFSYFSQRHNLPPAKFISKSLHELKLGTYIPNVQTITNNTTIIEALKLFLKNQVSCLPVVNDEDGQLIEIYAKFDVIVSLF